MMKESTPYDEAKKSPRPEEKKDRENRDPARESARSRAASPSAAEPAAAAMRNSEPGREKKDPAERRNILRRKSTFNTPKYNRLLAALAVNILRPDLIGLFKNLGF
jgi:hypothetical protein